MDRQLRWQEARYLLLLAAVRVDWSSGEGKKGRRQVHSPGQPLGPSRYADDIRSAADRFGAELAPRMHGDGRGEDRLRAPVYGLIKTIGEIIGREVDVHDEVTVASLRSRPDFAIDVARGRVGYVELKAWDKGVPENWKSPTKHDRSQFRKLITLPNILYTCGKYWALYQRGALVGLARLDGEPSRTGGLRPADDEFERILHKFLTWAPNEPRTLRALVAEVAPLCRLLRDQVAETIDYERTTPGRRPFSKLAEEWRSILFPALEDGEFADAYAQAVTFALLLARVGGISFDGRSVVDIAGQLGKQHSLMGEALSIMTNPRWVDHLTIVETLRTVIASIDWAKIDLDASGAYARLYEAFLEDYDPVLRRRSGTYYTPDAVAQAMVGFVDQVIKTRLGKRRGFAAEDVLVVDPAMGTGTFLVQIIDSVVETLRHERGSSAVPEAHLRELFASRLVGFELQVGSFAVAELRLHQTLKNRYRVELPREEVRFLSNALDDPDQLPLDFSGFGLLYEVLREFREGANTIKRNRPVMVVIGNPPWRERARGEAPWIEKPRDRKGFRASPVGRPSAAELRGRPSLDEFRVPSQAGKAFNLKNMWTFFWRWSIWKAFEANPHYPEGIVALITPKAYTTSEGYAGMRRYLRETADEGWIIDVTPEDHRSESRTRIFPSVQQPIAIGIFARFGAADTQTQARVHYISVHGSRKQKFDQLLAIRPDDASWLRCPDDWEAPFHPAEKSWSALPRLGELFPWFRTGVNSNRNWVWGPDERTLRRRWSALIQADSAAKGRLFKETRDRSINRVFPAIPGVPSGNTSLLNETMSEPLIARVGFRSFDRQYMILDRRVVDYPRAALWHLDDDTQIFMTEQHAHPLADGPGVVFSSLVPNVHYFNNRGGRCFPLYCDTDQRKANVTPLLLDTLSRMIGIPITTEDLLAYVAAVVANPAYTRQFRTELTTPGIRVPLSSDVDIWMQAISVGREVLWLHTYGERFVDESAGRPRAAPRLPDAQRPRYTMTIPSSEGGMPDRISYDKESESIRLFVGASQQLAGQIGHVASPIWGYRVGGMHVIRQLFSYRQANPSRRKRTSELDNINPVNWTAQFDDELLDLLNVLGRCVMLEPAQANILERVCAGDLITALDLKGAGVHLGPV
jgi:Type ISP C-terminal specificity domain/N-6 DNA Methylase